MLLFVGVITAACTSSGGDKAGDSTRFTADTSDPQKPRANAAPTDPDPAGAARARIGVVFDPSRVHPGDSVAGLVVERAVVTRAIDSSFVGDIAFRGEVELSGRTIPHFEADASNSVCFEADSVSAARLPRWAGDRRRPWFCFSNTTAARRALGPASAERPARIVIRDFVIHRGLSDQVNSARFVRLADG